METSNDMVSEKIVIKLFDQVKMASDNNTESIKVLTTSINDLITILSANPDNKKDIIDEIKGHDDRVNDRLNNAVNDINNKSEKIHDKISVNSDFILDNLKSSVENIEDTVTDIACEIKPLSIKVKTMILVVSIAFSLFLMIYGFVTTMGDDNIDRKIEQKIEKVIPQIEVK